MKQLITLAVFCIALTGCALLPGDMPMSRVMSMCDTGESFSIYVSCIKHKYDTEGNSPNDPTIKALYAIFDEIKESNTLGHMTAAQAKSAAYKAYLETVHADNVSSARKSSYCTVVGNTVICN